jgi:hypothetical protein
MHRGRKIVEDSPGQVAARLNGRILELMGEPREALRRVATSAEDVEDVQVFGDRLHLRVREGSADRVVAELPPTLQTEGVTLQRLRSIPATLEDVFIELLET